MSSQQSTSFEKLEEIMKFKKLLFDVYREEDQTLSQIFRYEENLYRSFLTKSAQTTKSEPKTQEKTVVQEIQPCVVNNAPLNEPSYEPSYGLPEESSYEPKMSALFLFEDPKLQKCIRGILPEDISYLNGLKELDKNQPVIFFSYNCTRLVTDELRDKIRKMPDSVKTIYMITLCPVGLPAQDVTDNIDEKELQAYAFFYEKGSKRPPWRRDNKTMLNVLEIAGYKKQNNPAKVVKVEEVEQPNKQNNSAIGIAQSENRFIKQNGNGFNYKHNPQFSTINDYITHAKETSKEKSGRGWFW